MHACALRQHKAAATGRLLALCACRGRPHDPADQLSHHATALQVNVVGAKYGMWGLRRFGPKPVQLDCLDFWPQRLMFLAEQICEQQRVAHNRPTPAAFVTFR